MRNKFPKIKFVKRANMWCKTDFVDGLQVQEWFTDKPKKDE